MFSTILDRVRESPLSFDYKMTVHFEQIGNHDVVFDGHGTRPWIVYLKKGSGSLPKERRRFFNRREAVIHCGREA